MKTFKIYFYILGKGRGSYAYSTAVVQSLPYDLNRDNTGFIQLYIQLCIHKKGCKK